MNKKAFLIILDGWGIGKHDNSNVIENTPTPFIDSLMQKHPHATVSTSGEDVGLPEGVMGNSEVGHLNIGAGRVIFQDLVKINKAVEDNSISQNPTLVEAYTYAKKEGKKVHLIGLLSDAGVHSMNHHAYKLCDMAKEFGVSDVFMHCLMDGRDTDPRSGLGYMKDLQSHLSQSNGKVASIIGRYYGMDRDKRWERIAESYHLMVNAQGKKVTDPVQAVQDSYNEEVTDEFIKPTVCVDDKGNPIAQIEQGDVVICYNFRTDRLREITTVLTQEDMPEYNMKKLDLHYLTMTRYDDSFKNIHIVYDKDNLTYTLGETISKAGKSQIRIAETEKYAHVTFFFSGGQEKEFEGETRILINSPKVATYDLQPEMSAPEVADAIVPKIEEGKTDFICLNFANGDMVGHTGIYEAIQKAVQTVDSCVEKVVTAAQKQDYDILIIADHGNAEFAVNNDGSANTAHTTNLVPSILVSNNYSKIKDGRLADIAPTILKLMEIPQPETMTGNALV
ncbi:MAG: 2,3-bisphosphoglycerate-independent phosphoglycerate mutase [Bacteroidales bacterium]|jgi:2,3-bisphosphoglycerate-independent phosphoglycerate mutase|nr:2,3-bisphosphoglycerate-independent phosphoglycerate mutase [Bacteroidales bacterium]